MNRNPWLRGRSTSRAQRVVLSMTATLFLASCSQVSAMRGNISESSAMRLRYRMTISLNSVCETVTRSSCARSDAISGGTSTASP